MDESKYSKQESKYGLKEEHYDGRAFDAVKPFLESSAHVKLLTLSLSR